MKTMETRKYIRIFSMALMLLCGSSVVLAWDKPSEIANNGDGSESNPYKITCKDDFGFYHTYFSDLNSSSEPTEPGEGEDRTGYEEELAEYNRLINLYSDYIYGNLHFELTCDIIDNKDPLYFNDTPLQESLTESCLADEFHGHIDGKGHVISGVCSGDLFNSGTITSFSNIGFVNCCHYDSGLSTMTVSCENFINSYADKQVAVSTTSKSNSYTWDSSYNVFVYSDDCDFDATDGSGKTMWIEDAYAFDHHKILRSMARALKGDDGKTYYTDLCVTKPGQNVIMTAQSGDVAAQSMYNVRNSENSLYFLYLIDILDFSSYTDANIEKTSLILKEPISASYAYYYRPAHNTWETMTLPFSYSNSEIYYDTPFVEDNAFKDGIIKYWDESTESGSDPYKTYSSLDDDEFITFYLENSSRIDLSESYTNEYDASYAATFGDGNYSAGKPYIFLKASGGGYGMHVFVEGAYVFSSADVTTNADGEETDNFVGALQVEKDLTGHGYDVYKINGSKFDEHYYSGTTSCTQCNKGYLTCETCGGDGDCHADGCVDGKIECDVCHGTGYMTCNYDGCEGGLIPHSTCEGTGEISCTNGSCSGGQVFCPDYCSDGKVLVSCTDCSGSGQVQASCSDCSGSGYVQGSCSDCSGSGQVSTTCSSCNGEGCDACSGTGNQEETCGTCSGSGNQEETCGTCSGTGNQEEACGTCGGSCNIEEDCTTCGGDGYVDCEDCNGTGKVQCNDCSGTGKETCGTCNGNGEITCTNDIADTSCGGGYFECSICHGNGDCYSCDGTGNGDSCPECGGDGEFTGYIHALLGQLDLCNENSWIYPFRGSFRVPSEADPTQFLSFQAAKPVHDSATRIEHAADSHSHHIHNKIYTLDGRQLSAKSTKDLKAGIYIVNGKKIVVK